MVKSHTVKLHIKNETPFLLTYVTHWFDSGRVADNFEWPKAIKPQGEQTIVCYERNWSMAGCSGFVQYMMNGNTLTVGFSNPSVGDNKVGVGIAQTGNQVWEGISSNDYQDFNETVQVGGIDVVAACKCTGGTTNSSTITFYCKAPPSYVPGYAFS